MSLDTLSAQPPGHLKPTKPSTHLSTLPPELLTHLLLKIPPRDLLILRRLSRNFKYQIQDHLVTRCRQSCTTQSFHRFSSLGFPLIDFCIRPMMMNASAGAPKSAESVQKVCGEVTIVNRPISFRMICDHFDSKEEMFVFKPFTPTIEVPYKEQQQQQQRQGGERHDGKTFPLDEGWMHIPDLGTFFLSVQTFFCDLRWETLVGFPVASKAVSSNMELIKNGLLSAQFYEDSTEPRNMAGRRLQLQYLKMKPCVLLRNTVDKKSYSSLK
ncbi:hypothetical protein HDV05_006285 [Chytridiales sp. JEL 0842]|nr:hypothetical protein HDV05_006285 [Chytridiales sp. JEL 0842]